jgi:hypothetical protein
VLAVGAFLRLYWLGRSPFYSDSALLYLEAARASYAHLLPGTGIYNSLLALNMPLYTIFLYPFANYPQAWTLVQAAANVVAVALLYLWAESAFGRWAGLVGGLLFATALYDTYNSGYIWQNCLFLPLVIGALYTLHLGMARRQRHWFIPHALLVAAAIQIHPLLIAFLPLSLVGLAIAWKVVTWYDFCIGIAGAVTLYIPTLLFEAAGGHYDLPIYLAYLEAPRVLDGQALQQLSAALGPRPWSWLGSDTPYAWVAHALPWFEPTIDVLVALSLGWLTARLAWRVIAPLKALVTKVARGAPQSPQASQDVGLAAAMTSGGMASAGDWRAELIVVGAPLAFLALTLRHASPVYVHYMFAITPPLYVAVGAFVVEAPGQMARAAQPAVGWVKQRFNGRLKSRWLSVPLHGPAARALAWMAQVGKAPLAGVMAAVVGVVIVAQVILTGAYTWTIASGASPASTWGAIPTTSYESALETTQHAAQRLGALQVFLAGDPGDPFMGLYWAQRQNNLESRQTSGEPLWTAYSADACALTPPRGAPAAPTLIMSSGAAAQTLAAAPGTRSLNSLTLARGATFPLVAVAPNTAGLLARGVAVVNGELRLDRAFILPASDGQVSRMVTLWTALRSTPPGPAVALYQFHFLFPTPSGKLLTVWETCAPSSWVAGEGMVVVAPAPVGAQAGATPSMIVSRETHSWWRPQIGKLTLETAKELLLDPVVLPLSLTVSPGLAHPTQAQLNAATITPPLSPDW